MQTAGTPEQPASVEVGYIINMYQDDPAKHQEYIKTDKAIMEILRVLHYNGVTNTEPVLVSVEMFQMMPRAPFLEAVVKGEVFIPMFHMEMNMFYKEVTEINRSINSSIQKQQELFNARADHHHEFMRAQVATLTRPEREAKVAEINKIDKQLMEACKKTAHLKEYKLRLQHMIPLDVYDYYRKLSTLFDQLHALQARRTELRMECALSQRRQFLSSVAAAAAGHSLQGEPVGPQPPPPPSADGPGPV
jgi:uncharacterized protein YcbK (DUF882 family)